MLCMLHLYTRVLIAFEQLHCISKLKTAMYFLRTEKKKEKENVTTFFL